MREDHGDARPPTDLDCLTHAIEQAEAFLAQV
jgi:hypothetical protein